MNASFHKTKSGVDVQFWTNACMETNKLEGHKDGPAISDNMGFIFSSRFLDDKLHAALEAFYDTDPRIFPEDIKTREDIRKEYFTFRTF
jgi:glucose-6-phosphate isomerase